MAAQRRPGRPPQAEGLPHQGNKGQGTKACCTKPAAQGLLLKACCSRPCCSRPAAQSLLLKACCRNVENPDAEFSGIRTCYPTRGFDFSARSRPQTRLREIVFGQVGEWLKPTDCKSVPPCEVRRFESFPVHQIIVSRCSSDGRARPW